MKYSPPLSPHRDALSGDLLVHTDSASTEVVSLFEPSGQAVGLVFALSQTGAKPVSSIIAGGIPIIRRQVRQLQTLGVTRIVLVLAKGQEGVLAMARAEALRAGLELELADSAQKLIQATVGHNVFAIDEGLLVDERMLEAFFADELLPKAPRPVLATRDPAHLLSAGLAIFPAGSLSLTMATALLEQGLGGLAAPRYQDLSGLDDYAPARRRRLPMVWLKLRSEADGDAGTRILLASAQKGCLDWPARFLHPPVENVLTRLLLPTPITPNQVSVFVFLLGLFAAWCFATGGWPLALVLMLVIGPLDGLDGKLARTRLEFSPYGDLEHVGDKIVEYACYICMAGWIGTGWAWAVCALIVLFALAEAVQGEFYRRLTGGQLDDAGRLERRFRLISGRRNTFMWTLIPFIAFGAWNAGFVMIGAYSVITFFFAQWRFFVRLAEVAQRTSPAMAENLRRTGYAFLNNGK